MRFRERMRTFRTLGVIATLATTLMLTACTTSVAPPTTTTTQASTPTEVECGGGPDFVSRADLAKVTRWFGSNQLCLRWHDTWVVLVSPAMNARSPGGAVLLVDTCRPTDFGCLQNGTPHPLSDFRAYPLPDPAVVGAMVLGRYVNDTLWLIPDSRCGGVLFDVRNDRFYSDDSAIKGPIKSAPSFLANVSPLPKASPVPSWCKALDRNRMRKLSAVVVVGMTLTLPPVRVGPAVRRRGAQPRKNSQRSQPRPACPSAS